MSNSKDNLNENVNTENENEIEKNEIVENVESVESVENSEAEINEKAIENNDKNLVVKENEIQNKPQDKDSVSIAVKNDNTKVDNLKNKKSKKKIFLIIAIVVISLVIILFGALTIYVKVNNKVFKNVYFGNENLSSKTQEEVNTFFEDYSKKVSTMKIDVYQQSEKIFEVSSEEINLKVDVAKVITDIFSYGRDGNIFQNDISVLKALIHPVHIDIDYTYDAEKMDSVIKNVDLSLKDRVKEDSYVVDIENSKLVITRGNDGNSIDYEKEQEKILDTLAKAQENKVILDTKVTTPDTLDADKIYNEIKKDAKDAYVNESSQDEKFVSEEVGVDVDKDKLEEAVKKEAKLANGEQIEVELTITQPKVKLADILANYQYEKLSGKTTYFDGASAARANNLRVALQALNGKIVMPGEIFSYNATVGDTTAAKGYLAAATFKAGTVVMELGGGICQTTSTLYNAVLMAGLEIVERNAHGLPVAYVQPSLDATVYSPVLDFKFKNNRKYPVKIVTSFSNTGSLNVSIFGIKEKDDYDIELVSNYIGTINYTTKYEYDGNLDEGQQEVISNGSNGYTSEAYLVKKKDGVVISRTFLSKDTYAPQQAVVRVGTRPVQNNNVAPTPVQDATPQEVPAQNPVNNDNTNNESNGEI